MSDAPEAEFPRGNPVLVLVSKLETPEFEITAPFQTREIRQDLVDKIADTLANYKDLDNPIIVRYIDDGELQVLAGYHRVLAFKKKLFYEIPAYVIKCSDKEAFKISARTNISRDNLTDYEKAYIINYAIKELEMTYDQMNKEYGFGFKGKATLSNLHRCMNKSSLEVRDSWKEGHISTRHVKELIYFERDKQDYYLKKIIEIGWNVKTIEGIVSQFRKQDEAYKKLEAYLTKQLPNGDTPILYIDGVYTDHYDFSDLFRDAEVDDVFINYWGVKDDLDPFIAILDKLNYIYKKAPPEETIPEPPKKKKKEDIYTLFYGAIHQGENWWEDEDANYALTKDTNNFEFFETKKEIIAYLKENKISLIKGDSAHENEIIHDLVLTIQKEKDAEKKVKAEPQTLSFADEYEVEELHENVWVTLDRLFTAQVERYDDNEDQILDIPLTKRNAVLVAMVIKQRLSDSESLMDKS